MKKALSIIAAIILSIIILAIALVFQVINLFIPAMGTYEPTNPAIITAVLDPVTK